VSLFTVSAGQGLTNIYIIFICWSQFMKIFSYFGIVGDLLKVHIAVVSIIDIEVKTNNIPVSANVT